MGCTPQFFYVKGKPSYTDWCPNALPWYNQAVTTKEAWILVRYEFWSFITNQSSLPISQTGDQVQVNLVSQSDLKFHFVKVADFNLAAVGKGG